MTGLTGEVDSDFLYAAKNGDLDALKDCLSRGADINCEDFDGRTALVLSAHSGHADCVRFMVQNGANVNSVSSVTRRSVLMRCMDKPDYDCIEIIVRAGADVNYRSPSNTTVLMWAVLTRDIRIIRLLDEYGINILGDDDIRSAGDPEHAAKIMCLAGQVGQMDVVEFLLDRGATVDIRRLKSHVGNAYDNLIPLLEKRRLMPLSVEKDGRSYDSMGL